jgi:hypothetical protein
MVIGPLVTPPSLEYSMNLISDPEFESLCPPLTEKEFRHLRSDVLIAAYLADSDPGTCTGSDGRL